jgi:hypothetical protein
VESSEAAKRLLATLFTGNAYDKNVVPVVDEQSEERVHVEINVDLNQIIDVVSITSTN